MSTQRQIDANRRNARKSTGPTSTTGKAASRSNAFKPGLYSRSQVITGEDPAKLRELAKACLARWEPATPEECFLVSTLIDCDWLLRRYSLADAKVWDYEGANDFVRDDPNGVGLNFIRCREYFPLLQRRADSADRAFHRALHDLERLQAKRRAAMSRTASASAAEASGKPANALRDAGNLPVRTAQSGTGQNDETNPIFC